MKKHRTKTMTKTCNVTIFYLDVGKVRAPAPWRLVTRSHTRTERIMRPPTAISATPPSRLSLAGAPRPNLMAEAISSLGSEKPSWAQRNGRISSSAKLLEQKTDFNMLSINHIETPTSL